MLAEDLALKSVPWGEACYNLCITQFLNRTATKDTNESFMCTFQFFSSKLCFPVFTDNILIYCENMCLGNDSLEGEDNDKSGLVVGVDIAMIPQQVRLSNICNSQNTNQGRHP